MKAKQKPTTRKGAVVTRAPQPANDPPRAPSMREQLRALLATAEGRAYAHELLREANGTPPFLLKYGAPKSEQIQVRIPDAEHEMYLAAAQRADLWPDATVIPKSEALRRLAWEGAAARGLLSAVASAAAA